MFFFLSPPLDFVIHYCSCWDLFHWQVQGAGLVLQGSLRQAISQWTHTHSSSCFPVSQAGRRPCERFPTVQKRPVVQTSCMIELSWANKLQRGPLASPQTVAAPHQKCVCIWRYRTKITQCEIFYASGEFITHSVKVVTSICPHPIF